MMMQPVNDSIKTIITDPVVNSIYTASDIELLDIFETKLLSLKYEAATIIKTRSYLYAPGIDPIAVLAHVDTVFNKKPDRIISINGIWYSDFDGFDFLYGLGGDDRSGLYIIWRLLELGHRPWIILLNDEEIGCLGAIRFIRDIKSPPSINYMIEFDRHGSNQAVYYGCENKKFERYIKAHGFHTEIGRFSDIGIIAPAWKIAAVNVSIGVHDEHEVLEHVVASEVESIIQKSDHLLWCIPRKSFKYVKAKDYIPLGSAFFTNAIDELYRL